MANEDQLPGLEFKPAEVHVIQTLEELRTIANPLRIRILDCLIEQARTVKEVGTLLGIGSTKLYYHVGELESAGLVRLVQTEIQSGIQLKYYRAVAQYYYLATPMLHARGDGDSGVAGYDYLAAAFEIGGNELRQSVADGTIDRHDDTFIVSRRAVRTTAARAQQFRDQLTEIDHAFRALDDPEGELLMEFVVALFPKQET